MVGVRSAAWLTAAVSMCSSAVFQPYRYVSFSGFSAVNFAVYIG